MAYQYETTYVGKQRMPDVESFKKHIRCVGEAIVKDSEQLNLLQREQAYMQGWEDGQTALREEMWEYGRD